VTGCDAARLSSLADEYLRRKSLAWPLTAQSEKSLLGRPLANPFLEAEEVEAISEVGFATSFEHDVLPAYVAELPDQFAEPIRSCVAVRAGRIKSPHATTLDWRPAGVMVLYNGGLPGLVGAVLGHALARVEVRRGEDGTVIRVHRPDDEQVVSLADAVYGWLHPHETGHLRSLPDIALLSGGAGNMFFNLLPAAERFVLGHELAHALTLLGVVSNKDAPVRELVEEQRLPSEAKTNWTAELSADISGFYLTQLAAGDDPARRHNGVVGALTALMVLDALDWIVTYPSHLQFPPDVDNPPDPSVFVSHPPGDLRVFVLKQESESVNPAAARQFEDFQLPLAVIQLLFRLHEMSEGGCIAPNERYEPSALCRQARAQVGWYCEQHRWR
jgi:hypothetical protein